MIREELAPGIVSYKNVMEDPDQFISDLEGLVELGMINWTEATQSDTADGDSMVKKTTRDCLVISLPAYDQNPELKNNQDIYFKISNEIDNRLLNTINEYKNSYLAHQWSIGEGWQILKYGKDNHFINHFDDAKQYPRTVSMSFYLNDNYEGGEIEFPRFNLKIKPEANQMIMFPSNYVYNHSVHPVISGTRYAIVGWWN